MVVGAQRGWSADEERWTDRHQRSIHTRLTYKHESARYFIPVAAPSAELQVFLRERISSYETLEALLLLARTPGRSWSSAELAQELNVAEDSLASPLRRLAAIEGLLTTTRVASVPRFEYAPAREGLARVVAELERAYRDQRLTIVQMMSENALARVRGAAAQRLAEAFLIGRPKK